MGALPDGTATLQVKVYKDATRAFLLSETDWLLPVQEAAEVMPGVEAENPQEIPAEPSSPVGEETQPELTTEQSSAEPTAEIDLESTDTGKNEETIQAPLLTQTTAASTAPVVEEAKGTWYYYVQSGDTLQKIATHYNGHNQPDALEQFDQQPHPYRPTAQRQRNECLLRNRQGDADVRNNGGIRELSRPVRY